MHVQYYQLVQVLRSIRIINHILIVYSNYRILPSEAGKKFMGHAPLSYLLQVDLHLFTSKRASKCRFNINILKHMHAGFVHVGSNPIMHTLTRPVYYWQLHPVISELQHA